MLNKINTANMHALVQVKLVTKSDLVTGVVSVKDIYPACACAARGYVIGRGVYIFIIISALFFGTNLLSPKILTFGGLF